MPKPKPEKKFFRVPKRPKQPPAQTTLTQGKKKKKVEKKVIQVVKKKPKKYEDQPKLNFKELMEMDVDPSQFETTHIPYYQDHYHYPGYVPFHLRQITEEELAEGWDEKQDNDRMRKQLFQDRQKMRKKCKSHELRLERNNDLIKSIPVERIDDPDILSVIIVRTLFCTNPRYSRPLYQWNFHHMEYKEITNPPAEYENLIRLSQGLAHLDTREAQWILEDEDFVGAEEEEEVEEAKEEEEEEEEEESQQQIPIVMDEEEEEEEEEEEKIEEIEEAEEEEDEDEDNKGMDDVVEDIDDDLDELEKLKRLDDDTPIRYSRKSKKLFNLFNFTDRGIEVGIIMTTSEAVQTIPTAIQRLNAVVCHYVVYDAYQKDLAQKAQEEKVFQNDEEETQPKAAGKKEERELDESSEEDEVFNEETAHSAKILERIVVQNTLLDCTADFKFYDDPADETRIEGSLLPLWTFQQEDYKGFLVSCLAFTPYNADMFGVSYSCQEAQHNCPKGYLSVYIIKDPMNPVYEKACSEPVTAFDYHKTLPGYVAYATSNGNVHCCDTNDPPDSVARALHSNPMEAHLSLVWQVLWDPDPELLHFYTIYADGLFCKWIVGRTSIMKSVAVHLHNPDIIQPLRLPCPFGLKENAQPIKDVSAIATTMTFHPNNSNYLMVGTAEGFICKVSLLNLTTYVNIYFAHKLNVLRVHFNNFCNTMFISAGEDRKVNIYDEGRKTPLYSFVQKLGVKDVQWAPFSSTVFALITDSSVVVYDLHNAKSRPLCDQLILIPDSGIQLSCFSFSMTRPIIMVGDTCGKIVSLKLSPNLRSRAKKTKRQKELDQYTFETQKLEGCMLERRQEIEELEDEPPVNDDRDKEESDTSEEDYLRITQDLVFTLPSSKREAVDPLKMAKFRQQERENLRARNKKSVCKAEKKRTNISEYN